MDIESLFFFNCYDLFRWICLHHPPHLQSISCFIPVEGDPQGAEGYRGRAGKDGNRSTHQGSRALDH